MPDDVAGDLFDAGGAPLSDQAAERMLLGFLLNKPLATTDVIEIIGAQDFCDPFNRRIFETLQAAYNSGDEIDMTRLVTALGGDAKASIGEDMTVGRYLAKLLGEADLSVQVEEIAEHLVACSERRAIGDADDFVVPFTSKFGAMRWNEIGAAGAGGYDWIIEDIIPKGETVLVFGDSGTGKSFSTFDMTVTVARGLKFYNRNVEPGLVIYVAAEAGKGFSKRKTAYLSFHGLSDIDVPFCLLTKRPDFFGSETDVVALIDEIDAILRQYRAPLVMIVLDTLSAISPGMNENASADVSRVRSRLQRIIDAFGVTTLLVHHKPKGGSTPRGHGSLTGDFETTIEYETTELKSAEGLPVHRATVRKQREGKKGSSWEFVLPVIVVGKNKWGNDETSCVVVPYDGKRQTLAYGFRANKTEIIFLEALFDAINEKGVRPPAGLPATIVKAVDIAEVRARMKERYIASDEDSSKADGRFRQAFKRAGDSLKAGSVIGFRNPLIWYSGKPVIGLNATLVTSEGEAP